MPYELFDGPQSEGRGEFVRLALEYAGADYIDIFRGYGRGRGAEAVEAILTSPGLPTPPFAPPFLRDGDAIVAHVANILRYLAPSLSLAPEGAKLDVFAHGLQLTIDELIGEFCIARRESSTNFPSKRLPEYFGYFERVLERNPFDSGWSVGDVLSYVDLSLFQAFVGFSHALPRSSAGWATLYPRLSALRDKVAALPMLGAYLVCDRRAANEGAQMFGGWEEAA